MHPRKASAQSFGRQRAFTLIELLVVISIISLLISLLLPALSSARRSGQRVACMATLRSIVQGVAAYAAESEDRIVGSPSTSGGYLSGASGAYGPAVQRFDFMGPLASQMGISLAESDGSAPSVANRFNDIRSHPAFLCRSNAFLASYYQGVNAATGRMVSYNTTRYPLYIRASSGDEAGFPGDSAEGVSWYNNAHEENLPKDWRPVISRMGVPANKIFCGDGARYIITNVTPPTLPDYDLSVQGSWGGAFSDTGPYTTFTHSWDRSRAPGNGFIGRTDGRAFAFRHSTSASVPVGAKANAYKANFVFYDGHAESLGDLEASNPHMWLPQGTMLGPLAMFNDVRAKWNITDTIRIGP